MNKINIHSDNVSFMPNSAEYKGMWRIGIGTIAFVIIILLTCFFFINNIIDNNRNSVVTELNNYAKSAQSTLIARMQGDFDTLNGVAICLSEMEQLSDSTMGKLVDQVNRSNAFSRMGYALPDGDVKMYDLNGSVYHMDFSSHEFFQKALAGKNSIEKTVRDIHSDKWVVRYAVPVIKDGNIDGVLIATHYSSIFSDIVDSNVWSGYGYSNIIGPDGDFIIRADNSPMVSNEALSLYDLGEFSDNERQALQEVIKTGGGVYSYTAHDGSHMTAVLKPLAFNDWYLVCSLSDAYISTPYYDNAKIIVAVLIIAMLIFLLLISLSMQMLIKGQKIIRQQSEENAVVIARSGKFMLRYDTKTGTAYNLNNSHTLFGVPAVMENYPQSALDAGLVMPQSQADLIEFYENMKKGVPSGSTNALLRMADGTARWHHADYTLLPDENGELTRSIISFYDNTEIRERELAYELRRNELAALTENNTFYLEANVMTGTIETTHGQAVKLDDFDGPKLQLFALAEWYARSNLYPDDVPRFRDFFDQKRLISLYAMGVFSDSLEFRALLEGDFKWNRVSIQMVKYPYIEDIKIYVVFNDIAEDKALSALASTDMLTGLLNREATMKGIEKYLYEGGAFGTHALFMIDIDNFKEVNDTMGHQVGDSVLADLGAIIRRSFRESDIVGRIGGDEFFAFMKNAGEASIILNKTQELLNELQHICASGIHYVNLSASIGIAVYHGNEKPVKSLNQLYTEADAALYKAKALGKNCFAFADELETVSIMPSAVAAHGALALNLRSLLNNLGGGIAIYHGTPEGALTPLFCNETLLDLLGGLSDEEFFDIYGKDAFAGVHPEDLDDLTAAYKTALRDHVSLQHTYRIQGLCGLYYWVTLFANFVYYDNGSFDTYAVYSDAEPMMQNRAALEERYKTFQNLISAGTVASFHLNLTSNRCGDGASEISSLQSLRFTETVDDFFAGLAVFIDSAEIASRFREVFNREELTACFQRGESSIELDIPCILDHRKQLWLRLIANMAENPITHEIEAMIVFFDVDKETHLNYMVQRLLNTDYEFLGQINVITGQITIYGGASNMDSGGIYDEKLPQALKTLVREDFYEESLAALNLEHIKAELEKADTYDCIFPTNKYGLISAGFKRWRCGYIGERRRFIMISHTDVTDLISSERDNLTGLYNQQGFYNRVHEKLKAHPDIKCRIHRFDFDDFKLLNDTLGFARGDQLLRDFGAALRRRAMRFGGEVIFARLEADHFVSFRPDDGPSAESLMAEISAWLESFSIEYKVTSHMGVYLIDDPEMDASAMCDRALLALKSIKGSFSQRVAYYDDSLRYKLVEEQELVHSMEEALAAGQFEVYFQPQFNYDDGSLIGAEALVRWNHPEKGLIAPGVFIPLFERNGFITRLDEYIWEQSCQYIRKWMDSADEYLPVSVSVNISRIDIYNPQLVQILKSITEKYGISASMLKLEITESAYMQNPEQLIRVVSELQYEGFTIEMDDFGSGYSSLNTLKDVPVDILKLDMKFLSQGESDERGGNILSSVIRMAHWLKIPVIAEGVETKLQADYLKSLGCYYMQGYHFARPMPAEQFENLLMESKLGTTDRYSGTDLEGVAAFWDVSAQTALLFNSFVGGAAILEYTDGKAEILRANDKFYVEINTTRQKYLNKQLNTLARFDDHNRGIFEDMLKEAVSTGSETECEVQSLPVREGSAPFWTHNRVRLLAQNGDSYLFYLATENITDRKNLEEELHIKTEALQLSISQIGRFVCNYDILTRELTLPEEYAAKYGLPTLVQGIYISSNAVMPEDQDKFADFYERIHRGEPSASVLLRIAAVNDADPYKWEQLDSVTVFDDNGAPVRAIITCKDVTAEKEQEAESVRNSIIIEHTGISVIDYDVLTDIMHFRSGREDAGPTLIHGYLSSFLDSGGSRIHPEDVTEHKRFFQQLIESKPESGSYEIRSDNWGTGYRWSRLNYVGIGDSQGKVYRIVGQISDIQKEKDDQTLIATLNRGLAMGAARYRFNATLTERVFALLFDTDANQETIERLLKVLGEYYSLSRTYIFENSEDNRFCSNTFEWCAPGVTPEKENFRNVSYANDMGGNYYSLFDEKGMFLCRNISELPRPVCDMIAARGIKSMLQCAIMDNGTFTGYIGFDECRENREWNEEQTGTLLIIARILGVFLMKLRRQEREEFTEDFKAALDEDASFVYIVDPATYEIKYCNKAMRAFFARPYEGLTCYSEFVGKTEPCPVCPMRIQIETGETSSAEVLRSDGMVVMAQASPMRWRGQDMFVISSIDISERHKLRHELSRKAASLQMLYDTLPYGIMQYTLRDGKRELVSFNRAVWQIFGYPDEQTYLQAVEGKLKVKDTYPDDLPLVMDSIRKVAKNGEQVDFEHRILRMDGSVGWVRTILQKTKGINGEELIQTIFHDITEQKTGQ